MDSTISQIRQAASESGSTNVRAVTPVVAVVIPAYRVTPHILSVLERMGGECTRVYVVDDACPDGSGDLVTAMCRDPRVVVLKHAVNKGVGGAMITGYRAALKDGADVIVKIDGDGQMDPSMVPLFVEPILRGEADYTKGNRFYDLRQIREMPFIRRVGNLVLSFLAKASTGYWNIFDPNNGYTAVHGKVVALLPLESISERYFFETDMLFRLNTLRAAVVDIPMDAKYGDEKSNLKITKVFTEFLLKHMRNFGKRLLYNYYLRDLSIASMELAVGSSLLLFGAAFGALAWRESVVTGQAAAVGTVMVPTLSVILGVQLVLAFLAYDIASVPRSALHARLQPLRRLPH
jgi:dolichol-phosphate mannosyltransferase